jgi:branched-chain amino acid transport system substrate-binding protein
VEIIDSGTDYSKPMADAADSALHTGQVATERSTAKRGSKDFKAIVTKLKAFQADWVFLADEGPEAIVLAQQMSQGGAKIGQNVQLLATDQVNDARVLRAASGALDGAYLSQRTADPQAVSNAASFITAFKSKYGSDSIVAAGPFYGSAYAATQVLLQAIKASPVRDGKISRTDVLRHLADDTFSTILGPIKFDSGGEPQKTVITISKALGNLSVPLTAVRE